MFKSEKYYKEFGIGENFLSWKSLIKNKAEKIFQVEKGIKTTQNRNIWKLVTLQLHSLPSHVFFGIT